MSKHTFKIKGNTRMPGNLVTRGHSPLSREENEWRSFVYNKPGVSFTRMKEMSEALTKRR